MSESLPTPPPWFIWLLRALVVMPMAVAAARALATGWFPVGDAALLAIRAGDVGTANHPLLGSWTSASLTLGVDVNNPGPLYPDLVAPFVWTVGRWFGTGAGIAVGVATINAASALGIAAIGRRLGGWHVERWCLLFAAAMAWAMGSELLIDIWQPHALLLPFGVLLMSTVALVAGDWRFVPWWLAVASLVVQTHIGYVYVVTVLGLLSVGYALVAWRRARTPLITLVRHELTPVSLAVVALAWVQPVIEQFTGEGRGNLARLAANAGGGGTTIGAGTAVKLVAEVIAAPPWWTRFGFESSVTSTPLTDGPEGPELVVPGLPGGPYSLAVVIGLLIALVTLTWLTRRRGLTLAGSAMLVATVGVVTALASLSIQTVSVVGLGSHHVRWLFALSLFVQITILWSLVDLGVPARRHSLVDFGAGAAVVLFVAANLPFHAHDLGPTADREAADTLVHTFDDLATFTPGGAVRYDVSSLRPFEPWSSAVQMRLRELGIEFHVDDDGVVRQLGERRRADGTEVTTVSQVERGAALGYDGPGCVISSANPLDPEAAAEVDSLIDAAVADVSAGRITVDTTGLGDDLPERFALALAGDAMEAGVLVADGLLPFLAADGRLLASTPAVGALIDDAERVARRVEGTLVLVADPPVSCLDDRLAGSPARPAP